METAPPEALTARLMETNEEYKNLVQEHANYDRQLEELSARRFASAEDEVEEHRLKKLKLQTKDRMYAILREHEAKAS